MLLLVFLNRRDSVFSLGINLHIQQHQANKRQPVNICSSINKQFILMKAHLIFAMRMVYSFINTKTLKEVPFHTPSKMLLHQFNMFTVWLWIIFQSHLLSHLISYLLVIYPGHTNFCLLSKPTRPRVLHLLHTPTHLPKPVTTSMMLQGRINPCMRLSQNYVPTSLT